MHYKFSNKNQEAVDVSVESMKECLDNLEIEDFYPYNSNSKTKKKDTLD